MKRDKEELYAESASRSQPAHEAPEKEIRLLEQLVDSEVLDSVTFHRALVVRGLRVRDEGKGTKPDGSREFVWNERRVDEVAATGLKHVGKEIS